MRDIQYRDDDRPEDLLKELGYETQDIHYKKFSVYGIYFFGFLTAMAIAGFVIMWFMVPTRLSGGKMGDYVPKSEMATDTPRLQTNITARTDIMSLRRKESAELDTNGVLDQGKGVYHITIDDAIDILAKRGLPKTAPVQSNGQMTLNGASINPNNSGQLTPGSRNSIFSNGAATNSNGASGSDFAAGLRNSTSGGNGG